LPSGPRRILAVVLTALVAVAFAAALPGVFDYVSFMRIERSPVIGIRFDLIYAIFVVFVAAVVVGALIRIVRLLGRSWRGELESGDAVEP
jgi:TRAP-type C4-dicarboxylate transport system permease small subunit